MTRPPCCFNRREIAFLSKNRHLNRRTLHLLFVQKFSRSDVTFYNLKDLLYRKGFKNGKLAPIKFSDGEIAFLKRHATMRRRQLHALFVEEFDRCDVSYFNIMDACDRHGIRTGRGGRSPLSSESRSTNGFVLIKTARSDGRSTRTPKHRWQWGAVNGTIPTGYKLKCLDGNKLNTDPSNWECIPNGILGRLHKRGYEAAPDDLKPAIMAVAKLDHAIASRKTKDRSDGS